MGTFGLKALEVIRPALWIGTGNWRDADPRCH